MDDHRDLRKQAINTQISHEMDVESFDERRITQLKSHIIQLERQIVLMSDIISRNKQLLLTTEAHFQQYNLFLRNCCQSSKGSPLVTLKKQDVEKQIHETDQLAARLISEQSSANVMDNEIFVNVPRFIQKRKKLTLHDLCSHKDLHHINFTQVAHLEHRLADLYGRLCLFYQSNSETIARSQPKNFQDVMSLLESTCKDLLDLSLLAPNKPWSQRHGLPEVTTDSIMSLLPKLSQSRQQELRTFFDIMLKVVEYRYSMLEEKVQQLEAELSHQHSTNNTRSDLVDQVLSSLVAAQKNYHTNMIDVLIQPLSDILEKFDTLADDVTDKSLREFLSMFQKQSPQLSKACKSIRDFEFDEEAITNVSRSHEERVRKVLVSLKLNSEKMQYRQGDLRQREELAASELQEFLQTKNSRYKDSK